MKKRVISLAILLAAQAHALMPESGIWWNPQEGGSGYVIEVQDDTLVLSAYVYEDGGTPTWYLAAGKMSGNDRFNGTLNRTSGGQSLTGAHKSPLSTAFTSVEVVFDSASTATLTLGGTRKTSIQRYAFGINEASPYKMHGEWALVSGSASFPIYFAERIGFADIHNGTSGVYAKGSRTGAASNTALTRRETDGNWSLLLDSSTSYYTFFSLTFSGLNTVEGRSWTFLKTGTLSGGGLPVVGFRSASATAVKTGAGPALNKRIPVAGLGGYEEVDVVRAAEVVPLQAGEEEVLERARQAVAQMRQP